MYRNDPSCSLILNMITIIHDEGKVKKGRKKKPPYASPDLLCCLATSFHLKIVINKWKKIGGEIRWDHKK